MYNVIRFCRHENIFMYICLLYLYFPVDWIWQYLEMYHNNVSQISIKADHCVQKDREKLFPWPCLMLCCVYENREVLHSSYMFQNTTLYSPDLMFCAL